MRFIRTFYGKLSAIFLILLLILGVTQIAITFQSSIRFIEEADQRLNLDLAENMAAELRPFVKDSLSIHEIENYIHYMMVMNPKVEIYLLDSNGGILAFFADPRKKVQAKQVDLDPIHEFLKEGQENFVLGEDPRHDNRTKPFSAAGLQIGESEPGYLYIILGGEQYDSALSMVRDSYIVQTSVKTLIIILIFTGVIGMLLFALLTRRLRTMTEVVQDFQQGNLDRRVEVKSDDELAQLGKTFNDMADTIVSNMDELRRTDALRRELVANVSHDLRSPLASIQGYLETILIKDSTLTSDERTQYLKTILNNTTLLNKLIGELFELSKLDAQQIKPNREPCSLTDLAQDVIMKLEPQAEKSGVNLNTVVPESVSMVHADIALLERAMTNLIDNAIRYTPESGTVEVSLLRRDGNIRFSVKDTGPGIATEDLPYIFDRFYRVDKSRVRSQGGTGLGLAIAQKILETHDGTISVESEVGEGTLFYFDLPTLSTSSEK